MHGYGVLKWQSGRIYAGYWRNDKKHGCGRLIFKSGTEYAGVFCDDEREGYGYYTWPDGRKYKGWWHHSKQHGLGMFKQLNDLEYRFGLWQMGKRLCWFTDEECDAIRNGKTIYVSQFSVEHEEGSKPIGQVDLREQYRLLEMKRLKDLKSEANAASFILSVGFHCPVSIQRQIDALII